MHTPCKNCVFAEYEEKTQTGCTAGRLEKFAAINKTPIEGYDEEKEFFVIPAFCNMYRDERWLEKLENKDELVKQARTENKISFDIVLVVSDKGEEAQLLKIIDNVQQWSQYPVGKIVVAINTSELSSPKLSQRLRLSKYTVPWAIIDIVERDAEQNRPNYDRVIHLAAKKAVSGYMCILKSYSLDGLQQAFKEIDNKVNDDLEQIYHEDTEWFYIVNRKVFKFLGGNHINNIKEKIDAISNECSDTNGGCAEKEQ